MPEEVVTADVKFTEDFERICKEILILLNKEVGKKLKQEFSFMDTTKSISISSKKLEGNRLKQFFYKIKWEESKGLVRRKKEEKTFYAWVTAIKNNSVYHISITPSTRNVLLHAINIIVGDEDYNNKDLIVAKNRVFAELLDGLNETIKR